MPPEEMFEHSFSLQNLNREVSQGYEWALSWALAICYEGITSQISGCSVQHHCIHFIFYVATSLWQSAGRHLDMMKIRKHELIGVPCDNAFKDSLWSVLRDGYCS